MNRSAKTIAVWGLLGLACWGLFFAVLSIPGGAFADPAPAAAPAPVPASTIGAQVLQLSLQYVLPPLLTAIGGLIATALALLVRWLKAHGDQSKAALVGATLAEAAASAVAHIEATMRPKLIAAAADGKITAEEGAQLKQAALDELKKLPAPLLASAGGLFGPFLETWLSGLVERANAITPVDAGPAKTSP